MPAGTSTGTGTSLSGATLSGVTALNSAPATASGTLAASELPATGTKENLLFILAALLGLVVVYAIRTRKA